MRQTIEDHIYAFREYKNAEVFFLNAAFPVPFYIFKLRFDLIIYHSTFLSYLRWDIKPYEQWVSPYIPLKQLKGVK